MNHYHFDKFPQVHGIAMKSGAKGDKLPVLVKAILSSDDKEFYDYIQILTGLFLSKIQPPILSEQIIRYLLIIHKDDSADLYINDFPVFISVRPTDSVKEGEAVPISKIADINKISFGDIQIDPTDRIVFCTKVGWKFELYLNLDIDGIGDVENLKIDLAQKYKEIVFAAEYGQMQQPNTRLVQDGWFPFVSMTGTDFADLVKLYEDKSFDELSDRDDFLEKIIDRFDRVRIEKMTEKWWSNSLFEEKKGVIMAGVNAYMMGDDDGFICSLSALAPVIEGLSRVDLKDKVPSRTIRHKDAILHLKEKMILEKSDPKSLLFPNDFCRYLDEYIFTPFDASKAPPSRHSISHGVLKDKDFSKMKALQLILSLDQLYYYISVNETAQKI